MGKKYKNNDPIEGIQTTIGELVRSQVLLGVLNQSRMPAMVGMQVRRIFKAVQVEIEIYTETRKALLERYGEKDENGELVIVDNEYQIKDREKFDSEFEKMLQTAVTLNVRVLQITDLDEIEVPIPSPAGDPPAWKIWKPLPVELDVIAYLLESEE